MVWTGTANPVAGNSIEQRWNRPPVFVPRMSDKPAGSVHIVAGIRTVRPSNRQGPFFKLSAEICWSLFWRRFRKRKLTDHAGPEALRRPGFFGDRSGPAECL